MEGYFVEDTHRQCPNCQTKLSDTATYCPKCGQKQITGRIKLRTLLLEFLGEVFNLDSRFFRTLGALFIPGKLTVEFFRGRHQRYFRPIRLFFVMAIVHFAIIAFIVDNALEDEIGKLKSSQYSQAFHLQFIEELDTMGRDVVNHYVKDTTVTNPLVDSLQRRIGEKGKDNQDIRFIDRVDGTFAIVKRTLNYEEILIESIPKIIEAQNIQTRIGRITFEQFLRINRNPDKVLGFLISNLTWMILMMMPALALLLKILYIRRGFYFVEHLIFSFHYHAFAFLIASPAYLRINIWPEAIAIAFGLIFIYLFVAMKRVYQQGVFKTGVKFMVLNSLYGIVFCIFLFFMILISALVF